MLNFAVVLASISLSLLLVPLIIPWLAFNYLGNWFYSPIDILKIVERRGGNETSTGKPNVLDLISPSQERSFDLVFSSIVYLISIPLLFTSLVGLWMKWLPRITIVAGILAVIAGITWIHSIQSIKAEASAELSSGLVDAVIVLGTGPYLVSVGGVTAISAYFIAKKYHRSVVPLR
jgi:hypothetical protein